MKLILCGLLLTVPLTAQSLAQLKKELKTKEDAAKSDPTALVEAAAWAKEKGMVTEMRRILQAVVKIDPDNETANEMLGFVKWEGAWVAKAKADSLRKKALEDEMKAKGFVLVDDVWVSKDEAADAKKGIHWHDGEKVSKAQKAAFAAGKTRHPVTGEFMEPDDVTKSSQGLFPIGNGKRATKWRPNRSTPISGRRGCSAPTTRHSSAIARSPNGSRSR